MPSATAQDDAGTVEPIAIIGMAARVPGARDYEEFWRNLLDGVESVERPSRETQIARGADAADVDDPSWVSAAPVLDALDELDAPFFGMTPHEAELTDPQHRLFLEVAHTSLEDAGLDPGRTDASIGVYAGSGSNAYHWQNLATNERVWQVEQGSIALAVGNSPSYLATTVSYKLNLRGPSLTVHTACSTSLVALHLACEALRTGECDVALAGGVSIELPHGIGYQGNDGFLSADGHCRPFDADASGTLWGSGVGVVTLKRLAEAVADGDNIRAVVRGNAVNNDGATKVGFSAPSVSGQAEVLRHALDVAEVEPRTIGYVEAHGTGTALGDPIEIHALSQVYGAGTTDRGWCGVGSLKANIGHLSQAAGVVSVIKAALAVERGLIPPTINFEDPNPGIDFEETPFRVVTSVQTWDDTSGPRRAAVSSFGIGGTNAHVVLEQAPERAAPGADEDGPRILRISAASEAALTASVDRLGAHLEVHQPPISDVAATLAVGRSEHARRSFVVATDAGGAVDALRDRRRVAHAVLAAPTPVLLFSGQGAQYAGMGAGLYRRVPGFAATVDRCAALLEPELGRDLRDVLFASGPAAEDQLRQTWLTQPALFVLEYALAEAWRGWGLRPAAMLGHSIGEYAAATTAGVFELTDALRLVAARGRMMQDLPPGSMLAVQLAEDDLLDRIPPALSAAAINGPGACVVSGPTAEIERFALRLSDDGIGSRALQTSHAFHSAMTEPVLADFARLVEDVPRQAPRERFVSNVTGTWITDAEATDPEYWAQHLRRAVRFGDGVATVLDLPGDVLMLECGPGRQLAGLARMQTGKGRPAPLHTLPGPGEETDALTSLATAAGTLWTYGVDIDTTLGATGRRVALPTYPFERSRHWVEPGTRALASASAEAATAGPLPVEDWFAVPTWRQATPDRHGGLGAGRDRAQRRRPRRRAGRGPAGPRDRRDRGPTGRRRIGGAGVRPRRPGRGRSARGAARPDRPTGARLGAGRDPDPRRPGRRVVHPGARLPRDARPGPGDVRRRPPRGPARHRGVAGRRGRPRRRPDGSLAGHPGRPGSGRAARASGRGAPHRHRPLRPRHRDRGRDRSARRPRRRGGAARPAPLGSRLRAGARA